jgi:hypothetical protein
VSASPCLTSCRASPRVDRSRSRSRDRGARRRAPSYTPPARQRRHSSLSGSPPGRRHSREGGAGDGSTAEVAGGGRRGSGSGSHRPVSPLRTAPLRMAARGDERGRHMGHGRGGDRGPPPMHMDLGWRPDGPPPVPPPAPLSGPRGGPRGGREPPPGYGRMEGPGGPRGGPPGPFGGPPPPHHMGGGAPFYE